MKRSRKRARSQTDGWETALQLLPDPEGCLICVHPKTLCLGQGSLLPAVIHAHKGFWDLSLNLQRYFHGKRSRRLQESQWASVFLSGQIQNFEEWLEVTLEDVYYIFFKLGRDVYIWSLLLNCGLNSTVWKLLNLKEKKKKKVNERIWYKCRGKKARICSSVVFWFVFPVLLFLCLFIYIPSCSVTWNPSFHCLMKIGMRVKQDERVSQRSINYWGSQLVKLTGVLKGSQVHSAENTWCVGLHRGPYLKRNMCVKHVPSRGWCDAAGRRCITASSFSHSFCVAFPHVSVSWIETGKREGAVENTVNKIYFPRV